MLRIAVCDDEERQRGQTAALLEEWLAARPGLGGQVEQFATGAALLETRQRQGGFDLYLLDIVMPGPDGMETARQLRAAGDSGLIVFVTGHARFAVESYDVGAFFYLLKPVPREKLFDVLDRAAQALAERRSGRAVVVQTAEGPRRVLVERIRCVERVNRRARYYCTDGTADSQAVRASFKAAVEPLLADHSFFLCGASFVLNLRHVTGVQGSVALLDDGRAMPLPRGVAMEFRRRWDEFLDMRGGVNRKNSPLFGWLRRLCCCAGGRVLIGEREPRGPLRAARGVLVVGLFEGGGAKPRPQPTHKK